MTSLEEITVWVLEERNGTWIYRQELGVPIKRTGPLQVGHRIFKPWDWTNGELAARLITESRNR